MKLVDEFVPHDTTTAKQLLAVLTLVAGGVTIAINLLGLAHTGGVWPGAALVGPPVVLLGALLIWLLPVVPAALWCGYPLGATAIIVMTNLATGDATVTAQIFYFFPVLYAGAQLGRRAGMILTAAAALAEIANTFMLLPAREAVADSVYVVAAMVAAAGVLIRASVRVQALVVQLREQAAIDSLTGLVTRRVLDSAAVTALNSAADGGTALLLVDLDRFKSINDVHGHLVGDMVLQQVSAVLHNVGRRTDVVGRLGGDEFAILMPGCPPEVAHERATAVVEHVRDLRIDIGAVTMDPAHGQTDQTGPADIAPAVLTVTASVGLAHLPAHGGDLHALYRRADLSLYTAKRSGRDQVSAVATHRERGALDADAA